MTTSTPWPSGSPVASARLDKILADVRRDAGTNLGFPDATDLDVTALLPLLGSLLNNVGAPFGPVGPYRNHTKAFELHVVQQLADLFRAPLDDRWGYMPTGSTEGTHCALWQARTRFPHGVLVCSTAAHYSVARLADMLRMPLLTVPTDDRDEMSYEHLATAVRRYRRMGRRHAAAIVVASVGTTMTEAVDDVRKVHAALDVAGVPHEQRWVHADAALAGIPLGLLDPAARPGFDFADGATSIVVSGHKFLGVPAPCAALIVRDSARPGHGASHGRHIDYVGSLDTTVTGSRSGHTPLMAWWALQTWGLDGLRTRADHARHLAAATTQRLHDIDWPAWRHPLAFTVVLDRPPQPVLDRWPLATSSQRAHLICMPGKTMNMIEHFVSDLHLATTAAAVRTPEPVPRHTTPLAPIATPHNGTATC